MNGNFIYAKEKIIMRNLLKIEGLISFEYVSFNWVQLKTMFENQIKELYKFQRSSIPNYIS